MLSFKWSKLGDTSTLSTTAPLAISLTGTFILTVQDSLNCTSHDTIKAEYDRIWVPTDTAVCGREKIVLRMQGMSPGASFHWYDTPSDTTKTPNHEGPSRTIQTTTNRYFGVLRIDSSQGYPCRVYDSFKVVVNDLPKVQTSPKNSNVCPKTETIALSGTPTGGTWQGPGVLSNNSRVQVPLEKGMNGDYTYQYSFTDKNGCSNTDTSILHVYPTPVASFKMSDTVIAQGKDVVLTSTSPIAANTVFLWSVGNPSFFQGTGNSVTYKADSLGKHWATLIMLDTLTNCSDTSVILSETVLPSSIENRSKGPVFIYPNPASNSISIRPSNSDKGSISLHDISGKVVFTRPIHNNQPVDVSELSSGLYFWTIKLQNSTTSGKLILQDQ